jgi:flagellin
MATINTNAGAMVALQNLNQTNRDMEQVQSRINTGLAVASAKDNGGVYAIAQKIWLLLPPTWLLPPVKQLAIS